MPNNKKKQRKRGEIRINIIIGNHSKIDRVLLRLYRLASWMKVRFSRPDVVFVAPAKIQEQQTDGGVDSSERQGTTEGNREHVSSIASHQQIHLPNESPT